MKLVILTQHKENYGAHDWDGKSPCPQYWKFKGGDTYVVENITPEQEARIMRDGIPTISSLIEHSDNYAEEYILNYEIVEDDVPECDEWETAIQLMFDHESREWVAERVTVNDEYGCMSKDVLEKREFWVPQPNGGRDCYSQQFTMVDGSVLSYSELEDWYAGELV